MKALLERCTEMARRFSAPRPLHTFASPREGAHQRRAGFTLIELLVVIVILGILGGVAAGGYSAFIESARKKNAADVCEQIKVAWTNYHRDVGFWPEEYRISSSGVKKMDTDMCLVLGKAGLLDVLYIDDDATDTRAQAGLRRNREKEAELKYGMLDPIGVKRFKQGRSAADVTDHLYQFVLDVNEDGVVDSSDGLPARLAVPGGKVRGDAAVWCWAEDGEKNGEVYAKSW